MKPARHVVVAAWTIALVVLATVIIQGSKYIHRVRLDRQRMCAHNLAKIDGAKQQWARQNPNSPNAQLDWNILVGRDTYLRKTPVCPSSGEYTIGALGEMPTCSEGADDGPYSHRMTRPEPLSEEKP